MPAHRRALTRFRRRFWGYYRKLLAYRDAPAPAAAPRLRRAFDRLVASHALLGAGPGQFAAAFPPYRSAREIEISTHGRTLTGQETEVERFLQRRSREQRIPAKMVEARRSLAALYRQAAPPERMRAEKAAEFERLRAELTGDGSPPAGALNNARLVAVAADHRCVPALREELVRLGGELPAFYVRMRRLAHHPAERSRLCPRS